MSLHTNARRAKRGVNGLGLQVLWVEPFRGRSQWVVTGWGTGADKRELARDRSLRRALRTAARKASEVQP